MAEQLSFQGSIQKLVGQSWKTVGIGQISILHHDHNPSHILLKLVRNKNGDTHVFQCKPKCKQQGAQSIIIKGTDTKKNDDWMLAVRAKAEKGNDTKTSTAQFLRTIQTISRRSKASHKKNPSVPPDTIKYQLCKVQCTKTSTVVDTKKNP